MDENTGRKLSILIVDGNRTSLALMDMLVRKLPNCTTRLVTDPAALIGGLDRLDYDIAILAARLTEISGIDLAQRLRAEPALRDRPILLTAEDAGSALRVKAQEAGVTEVLGKPLDPVEFRARILSLARPGPLPQQSRAAAAWDDPEAAAPGLTAREEDFLAVMVRISNYIDREPPLHGQRLSCYSAIIAHHLGLPADYCRDIRLAAPLHDVGKAGLADALRRKTGFLSPEERKAMEEHTRIGQVMLRAARAPLFRMAADIALTHHERWDGSGYPQRLKGEQIPLAGRIVAVADVFDALTSMRSYNTQWALGNAFNYLHEQAGEQFDPACVAAFERGREEVIAVHRALSDGEPDAEDGDGAADAA